MIKKKKSLTFSRQYRKEKEKKDNKETVMLLTHISVSLKEPHRVKQKSSLIAKHNLYTTGSFLIFEKIRHTHVITLL